MKKRILRTASFSVAVLFSAASMVIAKPSAEKAPSDNAKPSTATEETAKATEPAKTSSEAPQANEAAEMMKQMLELAKLNENHKLLTSMAGTWAYTVKMWMDPSAKPTESTGTAIRKATMDGRFVHGDYSGKFKMPGADGKMKEMDFKGNSLEGYDNVKQKFVSVWVDNMGTGIMLFLGTYDSASKTFTYTGEYEAMPGMKCKIREVIKIADKDHHSMEYYEDRGQGETKSMEINYTRKK